MTASFTLTSFIAWYLVGLAGILACLHQWGPPRPFDRRGHPALLTIGALAAAVGGPLIVLVVAWAEYETRREDARLEELHAFTAEAIAQTFEDEGIPRSLLAPVQSLSFARALLPPPGPVREETYDDKNFSFCSPYGTVEALAQCRTDTMLAMQIIMFVAAVEPYGYDATCSAPGQFVSPATATAFEGWMVAAGMTLGGSDTKERDDFEWWVSLRGWSLTTDDTHYIYTDPNTAAARVGWTAWLARFAKERIVDHADA